MLAVFAHWTMLSIVAITTSLVNAYYLIKHIDECANCSGSEYIRKHAKKEVKVMQRIFLAIALIMTFAFILSRFNRFTRSGFDEAGNVGGGLGKISTYALYFIFFFNLLTFLNFVIIDSKCKGSCPRSKLNANWSRVKIWNGLFISLFISYGLFRKQCPNDVYGLPSQDSCRRILCHNGVYRQGYVDGFEQTLTKSRRGTKDKSKVIQSTDLRDEAGKSIRGDQGVKFNSTLSSLRACAKNARDNVELMGFDSDSWRIDCRGGFKNAATRSDPKTSAVGAKVQKAQPSRSDNDRLQLLKLMLENQRKKDGRSGRDNSNKDAQLLQRMLRQRQQGSGSGRRKRRTT